jgi:23S rRNA G2445 N2-methylase RlmL
MKIGLLCDQGCEAFVASEVKRLVKKEATCGNGFLTAELSPEEMALLNYKSQTIHRLIAVITTGEIASPEDILSAKESLLTFDFSPFRNSDGTFRVSCERHGEHSFQGREIEESLGALLHDEKSFPVNLDKPDMDLWCKVVDTRFILGIDLTGRDLGKREYRAFHTRKSLRATVGAAALFAAGFSGETLVDPFSIDGLLPVEAAMIATATPVQKYKKEFSFMTMPFATKTVWEEFFAKEDAKITQEAAITGFSPQVKTLKMARSNAKLAGVDKALTLTKCEVSWLDTKFEEGGVDVIVTVPPASGKNTPLKEVEKLQDDLFYQAKYALSKKGRLLLITDKRAEFLNPAQRHKFTLKEETDIMMGGSPMKFLKFEKA